MKNVQEPGNRRNFIKATSLACTGLLGIHTVQANDLGFGKKDFPSDLTLLFQGDSITDAGRNKTRENPNDASGLGTGYALNISSQLMSNNPGTQWKCYNRGISGNKVFQLKDRWEEDCIQLQPDVLSILIGVNDFWHKLNGNYDGTVKVYDQDLRQLLDRTKKALPDIKIILGEPFAVKGGSAINEQWYPEFSGYQKAAAQIARDYNLAWIPYQTIFDDALKSAPVAYWCPDGVHPSVAGGGLMAKTWLQTFEKLF